MIVLGLIVKDKGSRDASLLPRVISKFNVAVEIVVIADDTNLIFSL